MAFFLNKNFTRPYKHHAHTYTLHDSTTRVRVLIAAVAFLLHHHHTSPPTTEEISVEASISMDFFEQHRQLQAQEAQKLEQQRNDYIANHSQELSLISAIKAGEDDQALRLLAAGADPWFQDESETMTKHHKFNYDYVERLNGPIAAAVQFNRTTIVRALVDQAGPSILTQVKGSEDCSHSIMEICCSDQVAAETMQLVLALGGDPNQPIYRKHCHRVHESCFRTYPLNQVLNMYDRTITNSEKHMHCIRVLLDAGADDLPQIRKAWSKDSGWTCDTNEYALHIAVQNEDFAAVRALIDAGFNVNCRSHRIVQKGNKTTEGVVHSRRSPQYVTNQTPLHLAVQQRNTYLINLLISAGAWPSIPLIYFTANSQCASGNNASRQTTVQICEDRDDLVALLEEAWSPTRHCYYPTKVRKAVHTALLCFQKNKFPSLPLRIQAKIFGLVACPSKATVSPNSPEEMLSTLTVAS